MILELKSFFYFVCIQIKFFELFLHEKYEKYSWISISQTQTGPEKSSRYWEFDLSKVWKNSKMN